MSELNGRLRLPTTPPAGSDLRSTAVGGKVYDIDPVAFAHFKAVLAEQAAKRKPKRKTRAEQVAERLAATRKKESEPVITEQELIDTAPSRQFEEAVQQLDDPSPVVIESTNKPARKTISEDEARIAHEEFLEGNETRAEVAERYGVEDFVLFTKWRELELIPARVKAEKKTYLSDADVRTAHKEYWNSNDSQATVAGRYGVTESTLSKRFKKLSLATKRPGSGTPGVASVRKLTDDELRTAHAEYMNSKGSRKAIAKQWGVSTVLLANHWERLGLPPSRKAARKAALDRFKKAERVKAVTPVKREKSAIPAIAAKAAIPATAVATITPKRDPEPTTIYSQPIGGNRVTIGRELMTGLLLLLPENGRWTSVERDKHLTAYHAVLDLVYEVSANEEK